MDLHLVRPGFEEALQAELRDRFGLASLSVDRGLVRSGQPAPPGTDLVFRRQAMPAGGMLPPDRLKPIDPDEAAALLFAWREDPRPWVLHAWCLEEDPAFKKRLRGISKVVLRLAAGGNKGLLERQVPLEEAGWVVQMALGRNGLWVSVAAPEALTVPFSGGVVRMRRDPEAPSRSYLKVEEALVRSGWRPGAGETVVDLGAAPGGWSHAFARRGCKVIAVDHGPLKLPASSRNQVHHVRQDGLRYKPSGSEAVDWMLSDMLIPPGVAIGLLRKWMGRSWARRIICNVKLPQQHPWSAVNPLQAFLATQTAWTSRLQHLFHDRREVTLMTEHRS